MKLKWHGHACFSLTFANGTHVLTDPFDASVGYAQPKCAADIVTESHQHHDHNDVSTLESVGTILSTAAETEIGGVRISALSCFHDDCGGTKRGTNLVFVFEADGLRIAHCGDLGHMLSDEQIAQLGKIDVLLVPTGGFYTIDSGTAETLRRKIAPKLTVPMHFLTPVMGFPISDEKPFIALNGGEYAGTSEIEITPETISALPDVLVLKY